MLCQSVTIWGFDWKELPGWEIEIRFGKFNSIEEAAKFGASVHWVHHALGQNHLLLCDGIGEVHTISQINITVRKQNPKTFGKLMINPLEDLIIVKLDPDEIAELPESFYSLAYGVTDENGGRLKFNGYLYRLSH